MNITPLIFSHAQRISDNIRQMSTSGVANPQHVAQAAFGCGTWHTREGAESRATDQVGEGDQSGNWKGCRAQLVVHLTKQSAPTGLNGTMRHCVDIPTYASSEQAGMSRPVILNQSTPL